jgi:hypothetical protein
MYADQLAAVLAAPLRGEAPHMSSVHVDKGWLLVSFVIWVGDRRIHVRLYPGVHETREGRRSPMIKEIRELIDMRRWDELAKRYPKCKALAPFRPAVLQPDTTTFRQASDGFLSYQKNANTQATVNFYRTILKTHIWPQPSSPIKRSSSLALAT